MTSFKDQWITREGENSRPHISLVMNFTRPTESTPALLTYDEVETFLHEFGHALHGLMANSRYESLSGTNVYRDFVELPSQLMENWLPEQEFLETFAHHHLTGEVLPDSLIQRYAIRNVTMWDITVCDNLPSECSTWLGIHKQKNRRYYSFRTKCHLSYTTASRYRRNSYKQPILPCIRRWLCSRLLRVQMGRSFGCRRFLALQGKRYFR